MTSKNQTSCNKNKWRESWLDMYVTAGTERERVGDSISCKDKQAGIAHCKMCSVDIHYGGRGFLAIRDHICTGKHQTRSAKNRKFPEPTKEMIEKVKAAAQPPAPEECDEQESDEWESDEWESDEDRVLRVMAVIHQYKSPKLWLEVAQNLVDNGEMSITDNSLTSEHSADLMFVLQHCDMSQVTYLKLGDDDDNDDLLLDDDNAVQLADALRENWTLKPEILFLWLSGLTDGGLRHIAAVIKSSMTLLWIENDDLSSASKKTLDRLLRDRRGLKVLVPWRWGWPDWLRQLKKKFGGKRISWRL